MSTHQTVGLPKHCHAKYVDYIHDFHTVTDPILSSQTFKSHWFYQCMFAVSLSGSDGVVTYGIEGTEYVAAVMWNLPEFGWNAQKLNFKVSNSMESKSF